MDVIQFLEYLAERTATYGLAAGLAEILVLRNRRDLVPAEILRAPLHVDRQVAS